MAPVECLAAASNLHYTAQEQASSLATMTSSGPYRRRRTIAIAAIICGVIAATACTLGVILNAGRSTAGERQAAGNTAVTQPPETARATGAPSRGGAAGVKVEAVAAPTTAAQPESATTGQGKPTKPTKPTMEAFTAQLQRAMERASKAQGDQASQSDTAAMAITPEQATPDTPWPPKKMSHSTLSESMFAPIRKPRRARPIEPDDIDRNSRTNPAGNG